jgi:uncharacterized protein involved in exopolysaccharide biosynthesis
VAEVDRQLHKAEKALIEFQRDNPFIILTAQLNAARASLLDLLEIRNKTSLLVQDARSLKEQVSRRQADSTVTLADELAALYLQIDGLSAKKNMPIQLQIESGGSVSTKRSGEQVAALDALVAVLQAKEADAGRRIDALKPEILGLQKRQMEAQTIQDRLRRDRDLARDTYSTLVRKLNEANVAARDEVSGEVRLASRAAMASTRGRLRTVLITFFAAFVGLMAGIVGVTAIEMLRPEQRR